MAGDATPLLKRQRDQDLDGFLVQDQPQALTLKQSLNTNKRQKPLPLSSSSSLQSYDHILSILDEDEEKDAHEDLSSLITTLQQELSPCADPLTSTSEVESDGALAASEEEVDDRERVFRHLLEASDDELGLPSRDDGSTSISGVSVLSESSSTSLFSVDESGDGVDGLTNLTNLTAFDGLWEIEDDAANYYALMQSGLFMEGDHIIDGINY